MFFDGEEWFTVAHNKCHKWEMGTTVKSIALNLWQPIEVWKTRCYKAGDNSHKGEYQRYSFYFGGGGGDVSRCSNQVIKLYM